MLDLVPDLLTESDDEFPIVVVRVASPVDQVDLTDWWQQSVVELLPGECWELRPDRGLWAAEPVEILVVVIFVCELVGFGLVLVHQVLNELIW